MRIRKKLIVVHTLCSLGLAAVLLTALRPAINEVVDQAEMSAAKMALRQLLVDPLAPAGAAPSTTTQALARLSPDAQLRTGSGERLGLSQAAIASAMADPREPIGAILTGDVRAAVAYVPAADHAPDEPTSSGVGPATGEFWAVSTPIAEARAAVWKLYLLVLAAVLTVYALIAAALELFVLPQHVYGPINLMLQAERALQEGRAADELIADNAIPNDELGDIMRWRNESILALRRKEHELADALAELGHAATDLKRKNHLLEAARRNLADADRLASLGMMSAGIAHELNTPLTVLKGLVEKLNHDPARGIDPAAAALMLRVVQRLERLGESLLDFARVRPAATAPAALRGLVEEAATLVRLDRDARDVRLVNDVPESLVVPCDADRMVQVLVNLLRNAVDAARGRPANGNGAPHPGYGMAVARHSHPGPHMAVQSDSHATPGLVIIAAEVAQREGQPWVSLTVSDNGPGLHPELLSRLFEPFVTTRLDSKGTGLGLAVADGIVREHGGLLLARNRPAPLNGGGGSGSIGIAGTIGAVFEVMLPLGRPDAGDGR